MITFAAKLEDKPAIGLGLSRRNTELLLAGKPIIVDVGKLIRGQTLQIILPAGETEHDMTVELLDAGMLSGVPITKQEVDAKDVHATPTPAAPVGMRINTRDENGIVQPLDPEVAKALAEAMQAVYDKIRLWQLKQKEGAKP